MKKDLLFSIFCSLLIITGTYSAKSEICHRQNKCLCRLDSETLVIELEGKLIHKNSKGTSIEATQNGSVLQVTFNEDLGEVTIIIENISGAEVYNNAIDSVVERNVFIPLAGYSSGNYMITFITMEGTASDNFVYNKK